MINNQSISFFILDRISLSLFLFEELFLLLFTFLLVGIQKGRSLRMGGGGRGVLEKQTKTNRGRGCPSKKNAEIFKMKMNKVKKGQNSGILSERTF